MGILSNRVEKSELSAGDHIYSWRMCFTYAHHGIYMGENKVVHFTQINSSGPFGMWCACGVASGCSVQCTCSVASAPPPPGECSACEKMRMGCGRCSSSGVVMVSCLDCFLAGGSLHRFDYNVSIFSYWCKIRGGTCTTEQFSPAYIVIERALNLVDEGFGRYHLLKNNCLDFAVFCKTGHKATKGILTVFGLV